MIRESLFSACFQAFATRQKGNGFFAKAAFSPPFSRSESPEY
jgi:hypothetical protein